MRSPITRRSRTRRRSSFSTTWPRSSACCSRTIAFAPCRTPSDEGITPLPDPDRPLNELEQQGKVVFERACAQCHGGPGQSTGQRPGDSVSRHRDQCPRPVDTATPARFAFAPCPPRLARNARTYEITLANGTKTRRTSSDPGRALLTGFVGGPAPQDDWDKFDMPGLRGHPQDRPVLPQQQRRHPRGGRRSLHRVLQAREGHCPAGCRAPGSEHGRRELRSTLYPRRARAAAGIPAQAIGRPRLLVRDWTVFPRFAYGGLKPFR